jgi:hypothetical protein
LLGAIPASLWLAANSTIDAAKDDTKDAPETDFIAARKLF